MIINTTMCDFRTLFFTWKISVYVLLHTCLKIEMTKWYGAASKVSSRHDRQPTCLSSFDWLWIKHLWWRRCDDADDSCFAEKTGM